MLLQVEMGKEFLLVQVHLNPEYDKNNKIGNFDVYARETKSVWLVANEETETYSLTQTAIKVEQKPVDESVFQLPKLPEKLFTVETVSKPPEFTRSGGWIKYLQTSVNTQLGAKYIKIPKGETGALQTVIVSFLISERGEVQNVKVENAKEVHPKLAEEAMRVITESRSWKPATIYGEKIGFYQKQPITFQVSK